MPSHRNCLPPPSRKLSDPMRIMRIAAVAALAVTLAACTSVAVYEAPKQPPLTRSLAVPGAQVDPGVAAGMFSEYRAANGLGPLAVDPVLQAMAMEQARAMAGRQQLGHDVGIGPLNLRAARAGYAYDHIAENVAAGYYSLLRLAGVQRSPAQHADARSDARRHRRRTGSRLEASGLLVHDRCQAARCRTTIRSHLALNRPTGYQS
jgi:ribosomal protein L32